MLNENICGEFDFFFFFFLLILRAPGWQMWKISKGHHGLSKIFHKIHICINQPKLIPWELYVTKNIWNRIYITKWVLIPITSQWPPIYLFWYLAVLQGERKRRMWLKTKEQTRNRQVLTWLCHSFPIIVHEYDARNLKVNPHWTFTLCPASGFLMESVNIGGTNLSEF